ncbi:MAG: tRNA (adenosine(37)-N6)-dimethylallyltransferase [Candidatus Dojkabacteria bacterium]
MEMLEIITGATGTGKSALALERITQNPDIYELVNADSMQIYRELSVGNNKGDLSVFGSTPIHLFDFISVADSFSVAEYQRLARDVIAQIQKRGKVPLLVGGSGMYIVATIYDYNLEGYKDLEKTKQKIVETIGDDPDSLAEELKAFGFDLSVLNDSDRKNPRRLQNVLAKLRVGEESSLQNSAKRIYEHVKITNLSEKFSPSFDFFLKRARKMLDNGLLEECKLLVYLQRRGKLSDQVANASGYRQVLEGCYTDQEELVNQIARSHFQLAKRQKKYLATKL